MRRDNGASIYEGDTTLFVADEQSDYYRDDSTIDAARSKLAWVARMSAGRGRLLDIGANFGYFAREAASRFDARGIEPSALTVQWGREHLAAPIEVGSIYDERPDFLGRFDVITLFDVIEHLPDPPSALARCREWLAPGGRLFLTTPDTGALVSRLLGRHWYYIDLTEHISLFNRANLRRLLAASGFTIIDTRTIGRRYKLSYIERRFGQLAADRPLLKVVHLATQPLRLIGDLHMPINLGDVVGVVAGRGE
jgi:2-polyprenyl-3-methyl-5-hydroxy-6-metoxy-1,4-benzoquinol methylase